MGVEPCNSKRDQGTKLTRSVSRCGLLLWCCLFFYGLDDAKASAGMSVRGLGLISLPGQGVLYN